MSNKIHQSKLVFVRRNRGPRGFLASGCIQLGQNILKRIQDLWVQIWLFIVFFVSIVLWPFKTVSRISIIGGRWWRISCRKIVVSIVCRLFWDCLCWVGLGRSHCGCGCWRTRSCQCFSIPKDCIVRWQTNYSTCIFEDVTENTLVKIQFRENCIFQDSEGQGLK